MSNPLYYKIKDNIEIDKHHLIDLFFRDWVDDVCNNQVQFRLEQVSVSGIQDTLIVDFNSVEDAVAMRLKGIPPNFERYLEIIN